MSEIEIPPHPGNTGRERGGIPPSPSWFCRPFHFDPDKALPVTPECGCLSSPVPPEGLGIEYIVL